MAAELRLRLLFAAVAALAVPVAALLEPRVAPRFTVNFDPRNDTAAFYFQGGGTFYYDADARRFHARSIARMDFFEGSLVYVDCYIVSERSYCMTNRQCYAAEQAIFAPMLFKHGFDGIFGWVRRASHIGSDEVGSRSCERWRLQDAKTLYEVCLDGDRPLYLVTNQTYMGNHSVGMQYDLRGGFRRHVDPQELALPTECLGPAPACGSDEVVRMSLYIFHPANHFNISNQDVADARGEAAYFCCDTGIWISEGYRLASLYEVSVMQKFGQYANCNGYPSTCIGGDGFHVGREAPISIGEHDAGQCADEAVRNRYGTWYSLPEGGRCKSREQRIGHDCSWRLERRVKTLDMRCLILQQGLMRECASAKPPFQRAKAVILRAYLSNNVSEGGCPAVEPPAVHLADPFEAASTVVV